MHKLIPIVGLSFLLIEDHYLFPEYDGRQIHIEIDDNHMSFKNWLTGRPIRIADLSQIEIDRMCNHLEILYNIQLKHNLN
jgi:hypothetical protein